MRNCHPGPDWQAPDEVPPTPQTLIRAACAPESRDLDEVDGGSEDSSGIRLLTESPELPLRVPEGLGPEPGRDSPGRAMIGRPSGQRPQR